MRYHLYVYGILSLLFVAQTALASGTGLTYHGRILKPDGTALESSSVQFTLQIRSPGSEACLLYQESQTIDMSDSGGAFSLELGANPTYRVSAAVDGGLSLSKIFGNKGTLTVPTCNFGTTYTPNVADGRILYISFNDGSGAQSLSPQKVTFVPFAIEAMQLNGYTANQFLRVDSGTAPALTAANLTTLNDLFNGTLNINTTGTVTSSGAVSGSEMRTSAIKVYNGSNYVQLTAPTLTGNVLFKLPAADGSSGQVLQTDGTGNLSWTTPSAGGGGTITAVNVTAPLINSGTATAPNIGIPLAGGSQSGYLSTADWNTFNNKLSASDVTSSLITTTLGYSPVNKAGDTMSGDLATQNITMAANKYLALSSNATPGTSAGQIWYDSGTIKYFDGASVKSVSTATGSFSASLPSGQIWVGNASGGAQAASLSGDINSVSNTGSVVVNKTTSGQSNTILSLDGSGVGTMKGLALNNTGTVTLSAQTASATYGLTLPSAAPTGNQTLQVDALGNLSWVSSTSLTDAFVRGGNAFGANATLGLTDNYNLNFATNNITRMMIKSNGNIGIGTANPGAPLHVLGATAFENNSNDSSGANFSFWKNRAYTATQNLDEIGYVSFYGHDGTTSRRAAFILGKGDGTPTAGSVSGSLGFYTTTPGASDSSEKMHITANGAIGIGTASPAVSLDLGSKTDAIRLPAGTTAQQPASPADGMLRFNTSNSNLEYSSGGTWTALGSGGGSFSNITGPGAINITAGGTNQNITLTSSGTGVVTSPSIVTVTNTTASTSYNNGALVVSGGVGVSGAINTNSNITAAGSITSAASNIYKANGDAILSIESENTSTTTARYPRIDFSNFLGNPASGAGGNPGINLINYRGTSSTTAAMKAGESLGSVIFGGSYNSGGGYYESASIWAVTTENFSSSTGGTSLQFLITPNGTKVSKSKMTLDQSGYLGLNTNTPTDPLHIVQSDSSLGIRLENQSSTASRSPGITIKNYSGTFSGGPTLLFESARGNSSSTSTIKSGDNLGQILFQGLKNGTNYVPGAQIYSQASEDWATGTAGTNLIFSTIVSGTNSGSERMRIDGATGRVGIGSSSPNNTLQVGSTGSSTTKQGVYVGTYLSTAGSAQYNGNWTSSGYWGLGPATNASDSTILLGNTNDPQGTWSGTQTLNLAVGGKIGVGTTSPGAPLDIRGSRSFEASMITMNTATDGYSGLGLYDETGANKALVAYGNSGAASAPSSLIVTTRDATSPIVFGINASEVARISAGGNVGIGTNNPGYKLDVNGIASATTFRAGNGSYSVPSISFVNSPGVGIWSNGNLNFSNSGLQMTLNSNSLAFNAGGAGPQIYQTGGDATKPSYAFNVDSDTGMFNPGASGGSNQLGFSTAGVERLRIDGSGNVGIGTTSPTEKLEVAGKVKATELCIGTDCKSAWPSGGSSDNLGNHIATQNIQLGTFWLSGDGGNEGVFVASDGKVGIGTSSPTKLLHVNGDANINSLVVGRGTASIATNTAVGASGLAAVTTGSNLTAVGYEAMKSITTGVNNTAIGSNALSFSTAGNNNLALGYQSMFLSTAGGQNTAVGAFTLANTTGNNNTALGYFALNTSTSGTNNTSLGGFALAANTTGNNNTASGYFSLNLNTTGGENTANGFFSLQANTTGNRNVALGTNALFASTVSSANTVVGVDAFYDFNNTTAGLFTNNTVIGYNSGRGVTTGINNTIIGANVTGLATGLSNNIILADGLGNIRINADATGNVGIGTTTPGYLLDVNGSTANVSGAWVVRSDQRLKRDIATLENPLDTVLKLRGVSFHWKDSAMDQQYGLQRGFIAQEMEQVVPEWVHEGNDGYKRIEKTGIEAYFVEAIKELYNKWFTDHTRIAELEKQNRELKEALCEMNPNSKICTK